MNALLPRFLKSAYRKEPISSFILIVGAVDAALGGVGGRWSLLTFGLTLVLLAAVLRGFARQKTQAESEAATPRYFLTGDSSRPPLPMLSPEKHHQ